MKIVRSALVLLFVLPSIFMQAQTADEIVNKHINAIGGKDIINKIESQVTYSDMSVMGTTLTSTTTVLVGKGFKNEADFNGQMIIQSITPTKGWMINPLTGQTEPQALPEDQVRAAQPALYVGGELFNYKANGSTVTLVGRENVEGISTFKLKLTKKEGTGSETFYFIDPSTYYIIKREMNTKVEGQDVSSVIVFSNYKKTDFGLVIPYTTTTNQGFEMTVTVTKVEFNKKIDPKIFEMQQ